MMTAADYQSRAEECGRFADLAAGARTRAESGSDFELIQTWKDMAEGWNYLAQHVPEKCFCGRAAVGFKSYKNKERLPFCGEHLIEAIANTD